VLTSSRGVETGELEGQDHDASREDHQSDEDLQKGEGKYDNFAIICEENRRVVSVCQEVNNKAQTNTIK
jgi:hypothetical protein